MRPPKHTTESRTGTVAGQPQPVVLGRITGLYGVRGWIRLHSYTDPRESVLAYRDCLLGQDGQWQAARIAEGRLQGRSVVARLAGVEDRDRAADLVGAELAVPRERLPEPEHGHYYWVDLVGLRVEHRDGTVLGTVDSLLATGANDVLVVTGEREILVPFLPGRVILDVDRAAGVIRVDWEWD